MADAGIFVGYVSPDGRKLSLDSPAQFKAFYSRWKGEEVEIEIRPRRTKRSLRQNRGFHALITPWARDEGHAIEDLKHDLLAHIFGTHEIRSLVTGRIGQVLNKPHTADLTVREFHELIERTLEIAAFAGYVLEAPSEYRERKQREERKQRKAGKGTVSAPDSRK